MTDSVERIPRYENEISLVDLATTLIRRRRIFYLVFVLFTGGGIAYALLATDTYEYVSLIEAASKSGDEAVEESATTIATMESRWLPEFQSIYRAESDRRLPFELSFSSPENTRLVRLRTETSQENARIVEEAHTSLIENVKNSQNAQIERERKSLERQIESLNNVVDSLRRQEDSGEAMAAAIQKLVSLESDLESLEPLEVLVVSRESAEPFGPDRRVIVVLAILLGGMMGIFLAFMAEFSNAVRLKISEEGEN